MVGGCRCRGRRSHLVRKAPDSAAVQRVDGAVVVAGVGIKDILGVGLHGAAENGQVGLRHAHRLLKHDERDALGARVRGEAARVRVERLVRREETAVEIDGRGLGDGQSYATAAAVEVAVVPVVLVYAAVAAFHMAFNRVWPAPPGMTPLSAMKLMASTSNLPSEDLCTRCSSASK